MNQESKKPNKFWQQPTNASERSLRNAPPLVKTELTPDKIIAEILNIPYAKEMYEDYIYQSIIDMLVSFHKSDKQWDEYRLKVEPMLLDKWGKILSKCRKYGFLLPEIAFDGKQRYLQFHQIIQKKSLKKRNYPMEQITEI